MAKKIQSHNSWRSGVWMRGEKDKDENWTCPEDDRSTHGFDLISFHRWNLRSRSIFHLS